MDGRTVCNHGADPRCGNDGPECIQHACAPHGQYRSEAQWFAAGSGRCRMGSCQDAGDGDERHVGKNDCSSLGTRKGRRSLNPVAGNAAGDNAEDRCHSIGKLCATSEDGLTANVMVVGSFAELRSLPVGEIKGKIVLFNKPFDKELTAQGFGLDAYGQNLAYRGVGPSFGGSLGAAAVLVRSLGGGDFRLPHTGLTLYGEGVDKVPAAAITAEDADLLARLSKQGPVTMRLTLTPKTLPPTRSYNVIADWKGSEHPEEVVLVSGHLDSWDLGTGAIDDGAGVAISMQTIHLLQSLNIHPKRTIRFVAWMNEEFGVSGATTYLQEHSSELTYHIAALESDLGCDHPTGLSFFGAPEAARYLAPVANALAPIGASVLTRSDEVTAEDIAGMVQLGVPGLSPSQDSRFYFSYHHSAADTLDKVNVQQLNENAAVMAVTAYALADASEAIPRRK